MPNQINYGQKLTALLGINDNDQGSEYHRSWVSVPHTTSFVPYYIPY